MSEQRVVVREICWRSIFPWLIIFRTFGLALAMPVLTLGTLGVVLTPVGWRVAESLFVDEQAVEQGGEFQQDVEANRRWPVESPTVSVARGGATPSSVRGILTTAAYPIEPVFTGFVTPLRRLISERLPATQAAYYIFGWLWSLLVWSFFGGAISRIAVMKLGREERLGLGAAVRYAGRKLGAYFSSPLFPLGGAALGSLPIVGIGFLLRWDWALPVVGVMWVAVLLLALLVAILLLGVLFGWPLMWGTISCEEHGDVFEAFSRSYSYTFQRPLHYLFYAFLATTFGALGWLLVYQFSETVLALADQAAGLGAGADRWGFFERWRSGLEANRGVGFYGLWFATATVRCIATGFVYGLFWCLSAAMYLLLRRDVDHSEFDDVFVEQLDLSYQLPAIPATAAEVPETPST